MEETSLVISAQRHLHVSAGPRLMGLPLKSWEAVSFPSRASAPLSAAQRPVLTTNKSAVRSNFSAAGRELARIGWFGEPVGCRGEGAEVTVPAPQQEASETDISLPIDKSTINPKILTAQKVYKCIKGGLEIDLKKLKGEKKNPFHF